MLEEEIKVGEQERESLRIETQRLRDELSDLRIEAEIVQGKLRFAEGTIERHHQRKPQALPIESLRPRSPLSETSTSATTLSSPTASTPPRSMPGSTTVSATPPSPPLFEISASIKNMQVTPMPSHRHTTRQDTPTTPRPADGTIKALRHSRKPPLSINNPGRATPSTARRPSAATSRQSGVAPQGGMPRSGSLHQIRGLIGKMQKLEERVHSARSKLPAPGSTPPRASPRSVSATGDHVPATVTVRSSRKRPSVSDTASLPNGLEAPRSVSRPSFGGFARPPVADSTPASRDRPSSRASMASHNSAGGFARPPSRSGMASARPPSRSGASSARPPSRSSMSGSRTPLSHYPTASLSRTEGRRPRSSLSGNHPAMHGHSTGVGGISEDVAFSTPTARRTTLGKDAGGTGIPTPSGLPKRQSIGVATGSMRQSIGLGTMAPPERRKKLEDYGETF